MHRTLLILEHELNKTLRNPGYVLFAFIIPITVVLILGAIRFFRQQSGSQAPASPEAAESLEIEIEGYVDLSGLIRLIPEDIPSDRLIRFQNEPSAQAALKSGEISAYYVIPEDIVQGGQIFYVYPDHRSYLDDGQAWVMERTLFFNLLDGDPSLADWVWNPVWNTRATSLASGPETQAGDCSRPGANCETNNLVRYIPSFMVALFFVSFMTSSSMLFNSIGVEKENRMIEILMSSVSPEQILAGKTLGLGVAGLLQTIVWLASIYLSTDLNNSALRLPENFSFPIEILIWSLAFFLGGYGLYSSLMAGAGAMVPKMKEAGAANYVAMFPLLIGYAIGIMAPMSGVANSPFLVFLSIFPLTSPIVMVMRLTDGNPPLWQAILALLLLYATVIYALRTAARMFKAQNLLSGQPFSLSRFLRAIFSL
jgi:ABC-2 type transport system permease protein